MTHKQQNNSNDKNDNIQTKQKRHTTMTFKNELHYFSNRHMKKLPF